MNDKKPLKPNHAYPDDDDWIKQPHILRMLDPSLNNIEAELRKNDVINPDLNLSKEQIVDLAGKIKADVEGTTDEKKLKVVGKILKWLKIK